jgi:hypothetical protein
MKGLSLENQHCNFSQALRLQELGVPQIATKSWVKDNLNSRWALSSLSVEAHDLLGRVAYSAWSVAELGVLLNRFRMHALSKKVYPLNTGFRLDKKKYIVEFGEDTFLFKYEAEARACFLILLIDRKVIDVAKFSKYVPTT